MRLTRTLAAALLIAPLMLPVTACSRSETQAATATSGTKSAVHPVSGLRVVPLAVRSDGKTHTFAVEVAATPEEQAKGLMFRTELGPDEGMIFPTEPPRRASFWMRNTVIPLDIIFIGTDHRILNIAANAVPYDETPLPGTGLSIGVLELAGGRAAELGIKPGDKVKW